MKGATRRRMSVCHSAESLLAYVVTYAYDPSAEVGGFVYLPGGHDEFARLNMSHIYRGRGYEGTGSGQPRRAMIL
jgi:hypothetical protein